MKWKIAVVAGISLLWLRYIMAGLEDETISNEQRLHDYPEGWDFEKEQRRLKRKYPDIYAFWEMRCSAQEKADGLFRAAKGKAHDMFRSAQGKVHDLQHVKYHRKHQG